MLKGLAVEQETRRFDEASKQTVLMRKKTDAVDYKYYTEANIMPIKLSDAFINKAISLVPELPDARFNRYVNDLKLSDLVDNSDDDDFMISPSYLQALCLENVDRSLKRVN